MPTSTAGAMTTAKMVPIATSTEYDCVASQLKNKWSMTAFDKRLSMDALSDGLRAVRLTDRAPSDVSLATVTIEGCISSEGSNERRRTDTMRPSFSPGYFALALVALKRYLSNSEKGCVMSIDTVSLRCPRNVQSRIVRTLMSDSRIYFHIHRPPRTAPNSHESMRRQTNETGQRLFAALTNTSKPPKYGNCLIFAIRVMARWRGLSNCS